MRVLFNYNNNYLYYASKKLRAEMPGRIAFVGTP